MRASECGEGRLASVTHSLTHSPTHCHSLTVTHSLSLTHCHSLTVACLLSEWWVVHLTGYGSLVRWFVVRSLRAHFLSCLLQYRSSIHSPRSTLALFACLLVCLLLLPLCLLAIPVRTCLPVSSLRRSNGRAEHRVLTGEAKLTTPR